MDWLADMLALPAFYKSDSPNGGAGVIQGSASEACIVALEGAIAKYAKEDFEKLVMYTSDQAHSSVEKAAMVVHLKTVRRIESDDLHAMRADKLEEAMKQDIANGLIPCMVVATIGTTSTTAMDDLDAIGKVCQSFNNTWLHIDAAFAGTAFVLEEFRQKYMKGIEYSSSFNFNPHKWMLTNFDCSAFWVKERKHLFNALELTPPYLRNKNSEQGLVLDYRNFQIPLGRRFRALKLWFVMRMYGVEGIQKFVRHVCINSW